LLVGAVLRGQKLGSVAERLEKHRLFNVATELRPDFGAVEHIDTEGLECSRAHDLPCQSPQLDLLLGAARRSGLSRFRGARLSHRSHSELIHAAHAITACALLAAHFVEVSEADLEGIELLD
jgi:hypothetical protein